MATTKHQLLMNDLNAQIRARIKASGELFGYVLIVGGMDDVILTGTNIPKGGVIQACETLLERLHSGDDFTKIRDQ